MIHLSTIHEKRLTPFHRRYFILSVDELENMGVFGQFGLSQPGGISIQKYRQAFPKATDLTIANLLLSNLHVTLQQGIRDYLLVYSDSTKAETLDLANALMELFALTASTKEEQDVINQIKTFSNKWTYLMLSAEEEMPRVRTVLNPLHV